MKRYVALLVLMIAGVANANELSVFGGLSRSAVKHEVDGSSEYQTGSNASYGGQVLFDVASDIKMGFDYSHTQLGSADRPGYVIANLSGLPFTVLIPTQEHQEYKTDTFMLATKLQTEQIGILTPYVTLNGGIHRTSLRQTVTLPSNIKWSATGNQELTLADQTKTGGALGFAMGGDVTVTKTTFVGMEVRYTYLTPVRFDVTDAAQRSNAAHSIATDGTSILNVLLKAGVRF